MSQPIVETLLPGFPAPRRGKVRDVYDLGERVLLVATDRISAFDAVLSPGIPDKGRILTGLSNFWFHRFQDVVPNHLLETDAALFGETLAPYASLLRGRAVLARKCRVVPFECVARGYLAGSGWKDYCATGRVCGLALPPGLREADRLNDALFTPATKADSGHDENVPFETLVSEVGESLAIRLRGLTLELYGRAASYAEARGILLADTKFEFGLDEKGDLVWIDEALTPDSSRFWPKATWKPGGSPPSFDKQYVRDFLERSGWDKSPPAPTLPPDVVAGTRARYVEAFEELTGSAFVS